MKYIVETDNKREMNLILNAGKMVLALEELKEWRRNIYKGYEPGLMYMTKGYRYKNITDKEEIDKEISVFSDDEVLEKIDSILEEVNYVIEDYLE